MSLVGVMFIFATHHQNIAFAEVFRAAEEEAVKMEGDPQVVEDNVASALPAIPRSETKLEAMVRTTTTVEVRDFSARPPSDAESPSDNFSASPSAENDGPPHPQHLQRPMSEQNRLNHEETAVLADAWSQQDCSENDTGFEYGSRRLTALPLVTNVLFQDINLIQGQLSGPVTWDFTPPSTPVGITGYRVYLADSTGSFSTHVLLGTTSLNTKTLTISNVTRSNLTHIFVHTATSVGVNPTGTSFTVCDVDSSDTVHVVNRAATTAPWGITEISFYYDPICSGTALLFATSSSVTQSSGHPPSYAADGSSTTAWVSNCTGANGACAAGTESWGIVGVCHATNIRCLKMKQCYHGNTNGGCPSSAGRVTGLVVMIKGILAENFYTMTKANVPNTINEETLVFNARRRRAYYTVFADADVDSTRETNSGFTR